MKLLSVNIGEERSIQNGKPGSKSGIFKIPCAAPVQITSAGLRGDVICDVKHHGGVDQAIYIYGQSDYAWWSAQLGTELAPGTFGENLTISGLESAGFHIGDRLQVGAVLLEVTSPRIPCGTLAARMGQRDFAIRFREAVRPGLYCRVLREGFVQVGDPVTLEPTNAANLTTGEMFVDFYNKDLSEASIRRQLAAPIAVRGRVEMEAKLEKLLSSRKSC